MRSYFICMYSYAIRMSVVCTHISSVCHSYVLCTRMSSVCIRMPSVCTRMSSLCHSYVLACHPYVTHIYLYVIRMSLVCGFTMNLFKLHLLLYVKNWATFHHFFSLIIPKSTSWKRSIVYYKSTLKSVLLSIITFRHLSLTYTQKYFIKAFYDLAKTWLCVNNVTYHSQKGILSVFYYVKFSLDMWNKQIKN